ncbi:MAG: hypothetical protein ABFS32_11240 [Bacteroidota bacterium]
MKKLVIILILTLVVNSTNAQSLPIFTDQLLQPSKDQPYKNFIAYEIDNLLFYNGDGKESKFFYIVDKAKGARIFEFDEKDSKARRYAPRFFRAEGVDDITIICVSLEHNYSWGTHIFIVEKGKVYHAGYIGYGADNFNFSMLALYCQFEKHEDHYIMFFQEEVKIINYATEKLISGKDLEFKVIKDKITRLK